MDLLKYLDLAKKHRSDILETESYLWKNPETGYREWNTTRHLAEIFTNAGYPLRRKAAICIKKRIFLDDRPIPV